MANTFPSTGVRFIGPKRPDYEITRDCYSLEEVAKAHTEAGGHWFDKDTMRFFNSRVCWDSAIFTQRGVYFVSSERRDDRNPRLYSVRFIPVADVRDVQTIGEFQEYASRSGAMARAKKEAGQDVYS